MCLLSDVYPSVSCEISSVCQMSDMSVCLMSDFYPSVQCWTFICVYNVGL